MATPTQLDSGIIPVEAMLTHWQGHRRLSRRMIEAFPEKELFTFSIGGMRTFAELTMEMLGMAVPMVDGMVSGRWDAYSGAQATTKDQLLELWDAATGRIDELWSDLPAQRFHQRMTAFGQYEGTGYDLLLYVIDNEIHHRGQGYVYLRALGIEPPAFWER